MTLPPLSIDVNISADNSKSPARQKPPALPEINTDRCTGCGRCVAACPPHVLWLESERPNGWGKKSAVLHSPDECTGCAKCYAVCPFDVIRMVRVE